MKFAIERTFQNTNLETFVFLVLFFLIVLVKLVYAERLQGMMGALFSKKYFLKYANELTEKFNVFHVLTFVIQNTIITLFCFFLLKKSTFFEIEADSILFISILLGISGYLIFQWLLQKAIAALLRLSPVYHSIYILKSTYLRVISFLFLPVLIFVVYAFPESDLMYYISLIFAAVLLVMRWFLILLYKNKLIMKTWFYFILYICTLEIAPLLVLGKIIVK